MEDSYAIKINTRTGGYQTNIFDKLGNWSCRIDAYIYKNEVNPHVHFGTPNTNANRINVRTIWKAIKHLFGL